MGKITVSRRDFLGQASCAAVGYSTMLSTLLNLKALNSASISDSSVLGSSDYKALVCISLGGGNDSFNMLVPRGNDAYNAYSNTRSELAISKSSLLPIQDLSNNIELGLHPSLSKVQALFNEGEAAFIANVGTLVEPATREDFWSEKKRFPLGLLSHSDQLQQWQTAVPNDRLGEGWGGRIADMINDVNPNQNISMNISLDGNNIFQTGRKTVEYSVGHAGSDNAGAKEIRYYADGEPIFRFRREAIDNMLDRHYNNIFQRTYNDVVRSARDGFLEFNNAVRDITFDTSFQDDNWNFSRSMEMVAKTIAAKDSLGFKRQTFYIGFNGWDHHDEVIISQQNMLAALDQGIDSFQKALDEINAKDCVVTFLISDFARTLTSNGNGTDHAWGGNVMAVGGPVKGQNVYGLYPETLSIAGDSQEDIGGGILIPTTSADMYFAELAEWFGVSRSNLGDIFPNLGNFYDYMVEDNPLSFLHK